MYLLLALVNFSFLLQIFNCSLYDTKVVKVKTLFQDGKVSEIPHTSPGIRTLRIQSDE